MKRIYHFITSLPFMAFLFLALAVAMAVATFVESSYGTPAARAIIYHSWWFELLWVLFAFNLINNFIRFRLYSLQKITLGIFHISFLFMLLGAVITRYISYEGMMHIREGKISDEITSSDDYFYASYKNKEVLKKVIFSELTTKQFSTKFKSGANQLTIKSIGFIEDAEKKPIASDHGEAIIDFVFSTPNTQGMQSYILKKGDRINTEGFSASFGGWGGSSIKFFNNGEQLYIISDYDIEEMTMGSQEKTNYVAGDTIPAKKMFLYRFGNYQLLIRNFYEKAGFTAIKSQRGETNEDAVILKISDGVKEKLVTVFGHSRLVGDTVKVELTDGELKLVYGAIPKKVPFEIYLRDFQLEKYPGSNSPSSYASEVELRDNSINLKKDVRIFMNNTLNYKGFKFFQSSYDQDEGGTVFSVNYDFWGTLITYIGYALLILGILISFFNKNSYFRAIIRRLKESKTVMVLAVLFSLSISSTYAQENSIGAGLPDIDKKVVGEFSQLWVQGHDGRIEPVSTLANEVVRKVSKKATLFGKSPEEIVLSFMAWPDLWRSLPIVKVSNKSVASDIGITGKYTSTQNLFDEKGQYRIAEKVKAAYAKSPAFRSKVDKEYIYLDERINICFMLSNGSLLKLFPGVKTETPWFAPGKSIRGMPQGDSLFVKGGIQLLVQTLTENRPDESVQIIGAVEKFQKKFASVILPSNSKKKIEIRYNKLNIFKRIFPYYMTVGMILLLIMFISIFRQKPAPRIVYRLFYIALLLGFLSHTAGLAARWYISGHAPWSNGYESIVYVAWAAMLAGLIFGRKYTIVTGTAAFLSGIALLVAHMNWMNPEVTNLVPVLKSYWLTIHVAVITASYGFIGLSAFLGILVLVLMIIRNSENSAKVGNIIEQLTSINELSAMVGLYALTIGTFLGAIWANESWGRYWGWDPKETWSLITVVIYSFVVHMRLIPSLKGTYNYNAASVIGFISVLMTYFGVNYFLSGLHSYGRGVAEGIHWAVPLSLTILIALMIWAWIKNSKLRKT